MNKITQKKHKHQAGMSIVSLMVGIAISVVLLLAVGELAYISKHNFAEARNIIELNQNGRDAIEFLRRNIEIAGMGISQPVPIGNTQLNSTDRTPATPAPGGYAVLPDWTAIGNFQDASAGQFTNQIFTSDATPEICANYMNSNFSSENMFFSLWSCGQCIMPDLTSGVFDKSVLVPATSSTQATCCQAGTSSCASDADYCLTPNYNCGGVDQTVVYQKLRQHYCVGASCVGTNPSSVPSGDILTVYFANTGDSGLRTFTGASVPTVAVTPSPYLNSYFFYVDANTSTLVAGDSVPPNSGTIPNTNIAANIEYMAVMVGESDLNSSINETYTAPQVNRYVRPDTANLYSYRVAAIRVALVVRSADQILDAVPSSTDLTLMYGNDGNPLIYTAPADQYMRKVFTTTIYLKNYTLPEYQSHCANVGGNYYLKSGGIPFADTWTTNDECCGGPPCSTFDWDTCETNRMNGGC